MQSNWDIGSEDMGMNPYTSLPGTNRTNSVPSNSTPVKINIHAGVAGAHPSRWLNELLNNKLIHGAWANNVRNLISLNLFRDHEHILLNNGNQSLSDVSTCVVATVCLVCRFHFHFAIAWTNDFSSFLCHPGQIGWPPRDDQFLCHHLVYAGSASKAIMARERSKYHPLVSKDYFACCAQPCTLGVSLEVSEPRMCMEFERLLLDQDAVRQQLEVAKREDPDRFENVPDSWSTQVLASLNTYLKNLLDSRPGEAKSILRRNKRFSVLFGSRCNAIFRDLGFVDETIERDGVLEYALKPTVPDAPYGPCGTTKLGSLRAYLEDFREEVQCLIYNNVQLPELPKLSLSILYSALACEAPEYDVHHRTDLSRYRLLGILPNQSRDAIANAYIRQWELLSNQRKALIECLVGVANDCGDQLLSDYAMTQSSVFDSQSRWQAAGDETAEVTKAREFLGLTATNGQNAEDVIKAFRHRLAVDPASADQARSKLMTLARVSTDDGYQAALLMESDSKMSLDTACAVLGVDDANRSLEEFVTALDTRLESTSSAIEKGLFIDAMDTVAESTSSLALKQVVVATRRMSLGLSISGHETEASQKTVNLDCPVGLHNIGNTCYLNSLLQYLFTVKPIREMVLKYEDARLDLSDECIKARRLGGNMMHMDRGEAVVAQAFAKELAILFRSLLSSDQAATRPSQRLANAVLLSTHTLLGSSKQTTVGQQQQQQQAPPPLPARPSPPSSPPSTAWTENKDTTSSSCIAEPAIQTAETTSVSSSRTLVEQDDGRLDLLSDKMEEDTDEEEAGHRDLIVGEDVVMTGLEQPLGQAFPAQGTCLDLIPEASSRLSIDTVPETSSDVCFSESSETQSVDQTVFSALEHQQRSSGTDQQDVEEVMGSIINRLQAAIKPTSVDGATGIQLEKIMETFFVTTVNYTRKFGENFWQHEISFDRSITAFPAVDGPCSLYAALDRNFDQQILEESNLSRHTAIRKLPPVLHILIQRSQSMGSKNKNLVEIPEILYLERYMDAPHDSAAFRHRVRQWALNDRIADVRSQYALVESEPYLTDLLFCPAGGKEEAAVRQSSGDAGEESWEFDGSVPDEFSAAPPVVAEGLTSSPPFAQRQRESVMAMRTHATLCDMMLKEVKQHQEALEQLGRDMQSIAYRLHAVICHRGHMMSGHYWVWIHDFEDRVWRWYNDADVKVVDEKEDMMSLSKSGEPYFLCYVRDEDKREFVDVPKRQRAETKADDLDDKIGYELTRMPRRGG